MQRIGLYLVLALLFITMVQATEFGKSEETLINNVKLKFIGGYIDISYNDYYSIMLEPTFILENGNEYTWNEIPESIDKGFKRFDTGSVYKYDIYFNNIPDNLKQNVKYIYLKRVSSIGLDASDFEINNNTIIIKNKVNLGFDDLIGQGYTIKTINRSGIMIESLGNNYIQNSDNSWNLTLDPTITFSTNDNRGVEIVILEENVFGLVWCDDNDNAIKFAVYNTNGTVLREETDINSYVYTCGLNKDLVSITSFNSTEVAIIYADNSEDDASLIIGDWKTINESVYTYYEDVDTNIGTSYINGVEIDSLDSETMILAWGDNDASPEYFMFEYRWKNGTKIGNTYELPKDMDFSTHGTITGDIFNKTHIIYGIYDQDQDDESHFIITVNSSGPINPDGIRDADTSSAEDFHRGDITVLNSSHYMYFFYESDLNDDFSYEIYLINGTLVSEDNVDIVNATSASGVILNMVNIDGTKVMFSYPDDTEDTVMYGILNVDGTYELLPTRTDLNDTGTIGSHIETRNKGAGINLYNGAFVFAQTGQSVSSKWKTYYSNGTVWNGIIPEEEPPDENSCTAPAINNDWTINMEDNCNIQTNVDLGTGRLNFTGTTGYTIFNATIESTNMDNPPSNTILYIGNNAKVIIS